MSRQSAAQPVKRGGRSTPQGFEFELSGGALCLDFANTVDNRPTPERKDLLGAYADLVAWARQAEAVSATQAAALKKEAARRPREAEATLTRAKALREILFALFAAAAGGRRLSEPALLALNQAHSAVLGRSRLVAGARSGAGWAWNEEPAALDRMLWPVLRSASELLTSAELARVRECAADACEWLFLDRSRNRSRRWCDMTVCGNRDKVRRHRLRLRLRRSVRRTRAGAFGYSVGT